MSKYFLAADIRWYGYHKYWGLGMVERKGEKHDNGHLPNIKVILSLIHMKSLSHRAHSISLGIFNNHLPTLPVRLGGNLKESERG